MNYQKTANEPDIYTRITNQVILALEKGVRPWVQPWGKRLAWPVRSNGVPYSGINVVVLWLSATMQSFTAPTWMTFVQAKKLGGFVREGEKGTLVARVHTITHTDVNAKTGEYWEQEISSLKGYSVFNVEQINGLPAHFYAAATPTLDPEQRIEHAERFFAATGANIQHGDHRAHYDIGAYYDPRLDYVHMPPLQSFHDIESYYATLAHELNHWTGHPSRLNRSFVHPLWGDDQARAMEELTAELGSAFLVVDLEITPEARESHAAYIDSWLAALKSDKRAIFVAARYAQSAAKFLKDYSRENVISSRAVA